jgi:hypothetical protein
MKEAGGYDPYPGHAPKGVKKHMTYRDLVTKVYQRMNDPKNTLQMNQVVGEIARDHAGQFGPWQATFDHVTSLIKDDKLRKPHPVRDMMPKTEDAHDMMPRKTQQIDRGKAMGFKDADEILDPASIPYGDDPGDPRGNPTNEGFGDMIQSVLARMFGPKFAVKKDPASDWSTISAKGSPDVFKVRTDRAGTVVEWTYQNTKTRAQERGRNRAQLSTFMSSLKGSSATTASRYR